LTAPTIWGIITKLVIAPAADEVRGRFCFCAVRNGRCGPTDYRSLLPNTSQAHRRDSQGGGVSFEEAMQTTLPEKVELLGISCLAVIGLLLLLV
jgi:hypothetical protein